MEVFSRLLVIASRSLSVIPLKWEVLGSNPSRVAVGGSVGIMVKPLPHLEVQARWSGRFDGETLIRFLSEFNSHSGYFLRFSYNKIPVRRTHLD